jgi:hypothetical protein
MTRAVSHSTASLPGWTRGPSGASGKTHQLAAALLVVVAIAGCGGSGKPTVCLSSARKVIAGDLAIAPKQITMTTFTGGNAMPQCDFRVAGGTVRVVANVDSSPQPYFRLERTAEEAAQELFPGQVAAPPQQISGLGLDAQWFPGTNQLMTTDGKRLFTVSVAWAGTPMARRRALGEAVARTYVAPARASH